MIQVKYQWHLVWRNVLILSLVHIFTLLAFWYMYTGAVKWYSVLLTVLYGYVSGFGITAGSHRLWTHRAYKAKTPLKILLCILQSCTLQTPIFDWVRDHRVHHKYCDTDADPHNATRGFFFSHMGWLLVRKHEKVLEKGQHIDLSDLYSDHVVMFQKKYYFWIAIPVGVILPMFIIWYYFNEDLFVTWCVTFNFRYVYLLHSVWSVNSVAHIWGNKPYDKDILPTENLAVGLLAMGEGWHNYHHVFPWDYKTSEFGTYSTNWTTGFIDFMSKIGWAYDLKSVSEDLIQTRARRTGDGSKMVEPKSRVPSSDYVELDKNLWGFGDQDMSPELERYFAKMNNKPH